MLRSELPSLNVKKGLVILFVNSGLSDSTEMMAVPFWSAYRCSSAPLLWNPAAGKGELVAGMESDPCASPLPLLWFCCLLLPSPTQGDNFQVPHDIFSLH